MYYFDETIDTVIFDLGQVLLKYDWESYLASFSYDEETYQAVADAMFLNEDWERGDEGLVTEEEWEALFIENAPAYEQVIREVFSGIRQTISPLDYTEKWVQFFKEKGFRLYYLSNYSEKLHRETKKYMDFLEPFDGGIFSYKEKCIKPDSRIYEILLKRYQIRPERSVFFDDRKKNVDAARRLGIKGVVFTPDIPYKMLSGVHI